MKTCSNCILPETFPGITFNSDDTCVFCQKFEGKKLKLIGDKKKYEQKFLDLLSSWGNEHNRSYDVLMAYSGGKDSTYSMYLLNSKYNLRILALSFDNGFISTTSLENIKAVTDRLGIDHILFKPQWAIMKNIFLHASEKEIFSKKTLERASTICTSCIGIVKSLCLKTAIEQNIPMIGFGWSPGQAPVQSSIMKNNPSLIKMTQNAILAPLRGIVGNEIDAYFLNEGHYSQAEKFPHNIHPMAWEHYNEEMILEEIKKLGWKEPEDTDTNSSNCLINAFANDIHIKKYGFHPYVWEIANMVREGVMSREEGYQKIYQEQDSGLVDIAKNKLGI
jgi:tRNA(Ile)-lysidine synthase TilS/MesJ